MNVLILSEELWPKGHGGGLAAYLYSKLLLRSGVNLKIVVPSHFNGLKNAQNELQIYTLPVIGHGKYMFFNSEKLSKFIEWSDLIYYIGFSSIIPVIKRKFKKPLVVHIHSYLPACPLAHMYNFKYGKVCMPTERACYSCMWIYESIKKSRKKALMSATLNGVFFPVVLRSILHADTIIFVSRYQQNLFIDHLRYMDMETPTNYVIYNPIPNIKYEPFESNDICFLGGLDPIKGFYILFKAWLKLYNRFPSKLRAMMTSSLPSIVEKVGVIRYPRLNHDGLKHIYRQSRTIIVPSLCPEPSPYAVVEALLHGRLLVATDIGGIPELTNNIRGVRLVPPGNVDAIVDAIEWALSMDRKDAIEIGFKNRENALRKFDNQRSVNELIKVFEKVLR